MFESYITIKGRKVESFLQMCKTITQDKELLEECNFPHKEIVKEQIKVLAELEPRPYRNGKWILYTDDLHVNALVYEIVVNLHDNFFQHQGE